MTTVHSSGYALPGAQPQVHPPDASLHPPVPDVPVTAPEKVRRGPACQGAGVHGAREAGGDSGRQTGRPVPTWRLPLLLPVFPAQPGVEGGNGGKVGASAARVGCGEWEVGVAEAIAVISRWYRAGRAGRYQGRSAPGGLRVIMTLAAPHRPGTRALPGAAAREWQLGPARS